MAIGSVALIYTAFIIILCTLVEHLYRMDILAVTNRTAYTGIMFVVSCVAGQAVAIFGDIIFCKSRGFIRFGDVVHRSVADNTRHCAVWCMIPGIHA